MFDVIVEVENAVVGEVDGWCAVIVVGYVVVCGFLKVGIPSY